MRALLSELLPVLSGFTGGSAAGCLVAWRFNHARVQNVPDAAPWPRRDDPDADDDIEELIARLVPEHVDPSPTSIIANKLRLAELLLRRREDDASRW